MWLAVIGILTGSDALLFQIESNVIGYRPRSANAVWRYRYSYTLSHTLYLYQLHTLYLYQLHGVSPMFPQPYVPTALCSYRPMFPDLFWKMSPDVPTALCSHISRFFWKLNPMVPHFLLSPSRFRDKNAYKCMPKVNDQFLHNYTVNLHVLDIYEHLHMSENVFPWTEIVCLLLCLSKTNSSRKKKKKAPRVRGA